VVSEVCGLTFMRALGYYRKAGFISGSLGNLQNARLRLQKATFREAEAVYNM